MENFDKNINDMHLDVPVIGEKEDVPSETHTIGSRMGRTMRGLATAVTLFGVTVGDNVEAREPSIDNPAPKSAEVHQSEQVAVLPEEMEIKFGPLIKEINPSLDIKFEKIDGSLVSQFKIIVTYKGDSILKANIPESYFYNESHFKHEMMVLCDRKKVPYDIEGVSKTLSMPEPEIKMPKWIKTAMEEKGLKITISESGDSKKISLDSKYGESLVIYDSTDKNITHGDQVVSFSMDENGKIGITIQEFDKTVWRGVIPGDKLSELDIYKE